MTCDRHVPAGPGLGGIALIFLPPEQRAEYVEDQYANLLGTESRREWVAYLIDLILELPSAAWHYYLERRRDSVK